MTTAFAGRQLTELLPNLPPDSRQELLGTLRELVDRWHALGFRDGNLDLRNLLAARHDAGWTVVKIDSPRYRLVRPGVRNDALRRRDLDRLLPQLRPYFDDPTCLAW